MVTLVLILHFIMGSFFPFLLSKIVEAFENFQIKSDMLAIGFILHQDYRLAFNQCIFWLVFAFVYLMLYAGVIYFSLHIL